MTTIPIRILLDTNVLIAAESDEAPRHPRASAAAELLSWPRGWGTQSAWPLRSATISPGTPTRRIGSEDTGSCSGITSWNRSSSRRGSGRRPATRQTSAPMGSST